VEDAVGKPRWRFDGGAGGQQVVGSVRQRCDHGPTLKAAMEMLEGRCALLSG
jgi:hypothetical protein